MKKNVNSRALIGIVMMSLVVSAAVAQSAPKGQEATQETQVRGVWIDPSTSLMWAAKDSGTDENYSSAVHYCRDLQLAGHPDWRLATLGDLQSIYDETAKAPGLAGPHGKHPTRWHVKGNLFLTGYQWAYDVSEVEGDIGAYRDFFNFNEGRPNKPIWPDYPNVSSFMRALCVRESAPQGQEATQETQVRGFWSDPSTSLMWAAKDSRIDEDYESAVNYCRDLRLADHFDWRLATLGELQGIYDKTANAPGLAGRHGEIRFRWHVKGNLFLTGYPWAYGASSQNGRTGEYLYSFNFDQGRSNWIWFDYRYFSAFRRALCVRGSGK